MKIHKEAQPGDIQVKDLKEGDVAVITHWDGITRYVGLVVIRYRDSLHAVGEQSNWPNIPEDHNCRVRVLPKGTLLEV